MSEGDGGTSAYADEDAGNSKAKQFTDEDVAAQQEERRAANIKALKENRHVLYMLQKHLTT